MKTVYEAIEQGICYRHTLIEETTLNENQVRAALWNLSFVGAIKRVNDSNGRFMYVLPSTWTEPVAKNLLGIRSIFDVGPNPFTTE
jgi:hypothetical protein